MTSTSVNTEGQTPLFSVIVPVYNTEPYIRQCVDSLLSQTFTDFEVVLVDDGSPDRAGAICDEYAATDSRFSVIHKPNGGLVSARKAGLGAATGRYIVNLDSDDYLSADHLQVLASIIDAHQPNVILFGVTAFSEAGESSASLTNLPVGLYANDRIETIHNNLICNDFGEMVILYGIAAAIVERELYAPRQSAVPETIARGEDLAVTAPLLAACDRVYVSDHHGYYYRNNPTSIMNTFRRNEPDQIKAIAAYLRSVMPECYFARIDLYVATHYFDFLDRAMCVCAYNDYRRLINETLDDELCAYLRRATCKGLSTTTLIVWLIKHRCFGLLWLLRKIKKRKEEG